LSTGSALGRAVSGLYAVLEETERRGCYSVSPPVGPVVFRRYLRARSLLYLFIPVVDEVVLGRGGCPPTFVVVKPFELIQRKHNTIRNEFDTHCLVQHQVPRL
jgi:hypothetical protein